MNNTVEYELDNATRQKMSLAKQGSRNPNYGKPRDPETIRKISQSQTKRHQKIRAFNEISKMSATRRSWARVRYEGFHKFQLIDCHDVAALYAVYDLKNDTPTNNYRVYYHLDGADGRRDFPNYEEAQEFMSAYQNPDVEFLVTETKSNVIVLGIMKNTPR
jgi:hypothetical protein